MATQDVINGSLMAEKKFQATGSGAMSETITVEKPTKVMAIMLHLSSTGATSENFAVATDDDAGSAYDTVLISQDMNTLDDFFSNTIIDVVAGQDLTFTYTNTDASTWGLTVIYGDK